MRSGKINLAMVLIIPFVFSLNCGSKKRSVAQTYDHNNRHLDSLFNVYGNHNALLSCLRCPCFVDSYNKGFALQKAKPESYVLLADTTCNRFMFRVKYISSGLVEKISEDFYNVVFIKKEDNGIIYRIINIEESSKLDKVAKSFFTDN